MDKKIKITNSIIIGAIAAIIFVAAITVYADLQLSIKDWLKDSFTHHWIGKGILAGALFFAVSFLVFLFPKNWDEKTTYKLLWALIWFSIFGTLAIFSFFIYESFLKP